MFSQQNKAAKLAWLESGDDSKPATDSRQIGRNLFDLYPDHRSQPTSRRDNVQFQFKQPESAPVEGRHARPNAPHRQSSASAGQQRNGSQASFLTSTNTTASVSNDEDEDDDDDDDTELEQVNGSLRQLQKKRLSAGAKSKWLLAESGQAKDSNREDQTQPAKRKSALDRLCLCIWRTISIMGFLLALNLVVYFWPIDSRLEFEPRIAPPKPRPKFVGPLAINEHLDAYAEKLYENQFHAPESMAWTADKRAFFTGVEGGFILLVEPYADRWTVAAKLNARSSIEDRSRMVRFAGDSPEGAHGGTGGDQEQSSSNGQFAPFCERDVRLYGPRAEFEPSRVILSRCSRPLGIRLAPDGSRLYVADPLSGLYRIELAANLSQALGDRARPMHKLNRVIKLVDFTDGRRDNDDELSERPTRLKQVYFGDDIAVNFRTDSSDDDLIYMTDCSRRWSLRYLFWLMLENDDTGRVLVFDVRKNELSVLDNIVPVSLDQSSGLPSSIVTMGDGQHRHTQVLDERGLSFPNGLELTADKTGLLISDLNNRRILRYHLSGPRTGTTELVMWVPGYSDNIRRGLDEPDGSPTYWFACGCAVSDGKHEIAEMFNDIPSFKRLLLRWLHVFGTILDSLGRLFESTSLKDAGLMFDAVWLKVDPYCTHGLVAQFNERGEVLRSMHGPSFGSSYKLLSEAHQVPLLEELPAGDSDSANRTTPAIATNSTDNRSLLYLGSVYYSYLGRIELSRPELLQSSSASS